MKKYYLPSCPFCGARLGKLEAFVAKNKPIHRCVGCGRESEVVMKRKIYSSLWIVQLLAVSVFVISMLLGGSFYLFGLILVLIVFGGFYWVSPYMIDLEPPRYIKKKIPWYKKMFVKERKDQKHKASKDNKLNQRDKTDQILDMPGDQDDEKEIYSN